LSDTIDPSLINKDLKTRFIGQQVLYLPTITSTNEIARQEALRKAPEGTVVIAERQTAGRGRLKRTWITTEGNIAVSLILYPPKKYLYTLTMIASLGVANAIETVTGVKCQLKWPNDVLIEGKKVGGILIETRTSIEKVDFAVVGIGINVSMKTSQYPEIAPVATSLLEVTGKTIHREELLKQLFIEIERYYMRTLSGEQVVNEWRDRLVTLGKAVCVRQGDEIFEGTAENVTEEGSLILRRHDGVLMRFMAGDVSLK